MPARSTPAPPDADYAVGDPRPAAPPSVRLTGTRGPVDLPPLPIGGLTRRRMLWIAVALATVWIVIGFTRQVRDASAASAHADSLRAGNAALQDEVAALQRERDLIQRPEFIGLQARAFGLGVRHEIPFTLSPDAAPLPSDAPGSAPAALAAQSAWSSPVDAWLSVLFGPSP
jgi:hypothetical protein